MTLLLLVLLAAEIAPYHAQSIEPVQAKSIEPVRAHTVEPVKPAQEVEPIGPAGVDRAQVQGAPAPGLAGAWAISIPGVAWTRELDRGATVVRETHAGPGAGLGTLRILRGGEYRWGSGRGRLEQVVPRRDARAGVAYWRVSDGSSEYYLALEGGELKLYSPGTNLYAASGRRIGR